MEVPSLSRERGGGSSKALQVGGVKETIILAPVKTVRKTLSGTFALGVRTVSVGEREMGLHSQCNREYIASVQRGGVGMGGVSG